MVETNKYLDTRPKDDQTEVHYHLGLVQWSLVNNLPPSSRWTENIEYAQTRQQVLMESLQLTFVDNFESYVGLCTPSLHNG